MEVGVRELRAHLSRYLALVRDGEVIEVTDRDRPIARLIPASETEMLPEVADLIASGVVAWAGTRFRPSLPTATLKGPGPSLADILSEDRGE